ncbi:MAG: CPBP family intramembrane metalloprotease [Thermoplasmata archaeon]|nr:CPBP family intramembrane metalloprotease [Thermoplasmata archaeon]
MSGEYDEKWYGVPPAGEKPTPPKWRYVGEILAVIFIEFFLWGLYRYYTAPIYGHFGTWKFYVGHIIAAPTIALGPILIYWRYYRRERGLPFRFTTKRLVSSVLVGLFAAIIWRVLEMVVYDSMAVAWGVAEGGTRSFYSLLNQTTASLFLLMTFVQFFIVGPVEELEFRSFVQDQSARVLKNWQALTLSSILFGLSHIPIAITIYKMPAWQLFVAEIGWITAGAVFGALYMWSRNIFACMVMHAVGNWQLSVFYISSNYPGGVNPGVDIIIGTLTAVVVNSIMILLFYAVFRYYWRPLERGELTVGGRLLERLKELDSERTPVKKRVGAIVITTVLTLGVILSIASAAGIPYGTRSHPSGGEGVFSIEKYSETKERVEGSGHLAEGEHYVIELNSTPKKVVKGVRVVLTWKDEDDIRRMGRLYRNQPDKFSVVISGPNSTERDEGSNPRGGEGRIEVNLTVNDGTIVALSGNYTISVTITLEDSGPYVGRFGVFGYLDGENDFSYEMEVTYLTEG